MKESQNWYVRRGKEVKGPFPAGLISSYLLLERLHENDQVSHDRQEWQRIADVPELMPAVLQAARANPDDEEAQRHLEAARRWADERRDMKGPPPVGERRSPEGAAEVMLREAHQARSADAASPMVRRRDYLILGGILLLLVAIPLLLPSTPKPSEPQCDAPAAPAVNWSSCRLEAAQLANSDLSGAIMRNAIATGAVLRAANLQGADMAYINFTLANLRGANMQGATLKGATLRRADLSSANLQGADLSYADLSDAVLEGTVLNGARLDNALWAGGLVCLPGSVGECRLARPAP